MTRRTAPKGSSIEYRMALHTRVAPSGCWVWTGARDNKGYGRIRVDGKTAYAHRVSYEIHVGPIAAVLEIDHLCRNRACNNPLHLQAVTPSVNVRRGTSPGARALRRDTCLRGHAYAEHGVLCAGRRICRLCRDINMANYHSRMADRKRWAA